MSDIFTLCVSLKISCQLHGEDGVEKGGDKSSIQAAHRPKNFEQQQPQRHTVLLHEGDNETGSPHNMHNNSKALTEVSQAEQGRL